MSQNQNTPQDGQQVLELVRAVEGEDAYRRVKKAYDLGMTSEQGQQAGLVADAERRRAEAQGDGQE